MPPTTSPPPQIGRRLLNFLASSTAKSCTTRSLSTCLRISVPTSEKNTLPPSNLRRLSTTTPSTLLLGAGPAGLTALAHLLDHQPKESSNQDRILWLDASSFSAGRINAAYRSVPANTRVELFLQFARAFDAFREARPEMLAPLVKALHSSGGGCDLGVVADVLLALTAHLRGHPAVVSRAARLETATLHRRQGVWSTPHGCAKRLILAPGAHPSLRALPVPIRRLDLDDVLSRNQDSEPLPERVAVIGASHSAVLVLRALSGDSRVKKILWLTRHPLRYAEYHEAGWIARDNTGLKGVAAAWAKENLESPGPAAPIVKVSYKKAEEEEVLRTHLPACEAVVQAIGFSRNPLPKLVDGETGREMRVEFDHDAGIFTDGAAGGRRVEGLYGLGIAFPERVVDRKYGHEEMNVGVWKFVKAVRRWGGDWDAVYK